MKVGKSAYYAWKAKPACLITEEELHLYRRAKVLFKASRESLGSRELAKKLRSEGISITRYRMMKVMKKLNLKVTQRLAYKVTRLQQSGSTVMPLPIIYSIKISTH